MARRCSDATKRLLVSQNGNLPKSPPWLAAAQWDALHNRPMSLRRERRMCQVLGFDLPSEPQEVEPCPDCGNVHTGRCNGRPVATVACLAPGEVVRKAPRATTKHKRSFRPRLPVALGERVKRADVTNIDIAEAIEQLLDEHEKTQ